MPMPWAVLSRSTSNTRTSPSPAAETIVGVFAFGRNLVWKMLFLCPVWIESISRKGCGESEGVSLLVSAVQMHILLVSSESALVS